MTLDLSAVTDSLIGLVKDAWAVAPIWTEIGGAGSGPTFTPAFTGLAPDAVRQEPGPQLVVRRRIHMRPAKLFSVLLQVPGGLT